MLDTLVAGAGVTFKDLVVKEKMVSPTPCVMLKPVPVNMSGVSSPETSDKKTEDEVVRHYKPQVKSYEGGARPKTLCPLSRIKQGISTLAHSLQLAAEEFKKIREPKNIQTERRILGKCNAGIQFLVERN